MSILSQPTGCGGCLALAILGVIVMAVWSTHEKTASPRTAGTPSRASDAETPKVFKMGETANVGYTSYCVWKAWWSRRLSSNEFLDQKPDAVFLFLDLTVRNDDKKARTIPPFKLTDEAGAEHEASDKTWIVEGSIGMLDSLNPGVQKRGYVVFDVPQERCYRLEVSGGYWSEQKAFITIEPCVSR